MKNIIYIFLLCSSFCLSQNDTIVNHLEDVLLPDVYAKEKSTGYKTTALNDSVILNNSESFTTLLRFNSTIYFKEYGFGMLSSPSFRGTGSSHTATIWNGININSQLNGQTDFNTLTVTTFDNVQVRNGGGSIKYGSGAIGGTVHLNNELSFNRQFSNQIVSAYGSFSTLQSTYKSVYGSEQLAINAGVSYNSSDNDYQYLGANAVNTNGEFYNVSPNFNIAYKINPFNKLSLYTNYFNGIKHLSGTLTASSNDKYFNESAKGLVVWDYKKNRFTVATKAAYLYELYNYFDNAEVNQYSYGKASTLLFNNDVEYKINNQIRVQHVIEYTGVLGNGTSLIRKRRNQLSDAIILTHQPTRKLKYHLKVRKDFNSDYETPLLYAIGSSYNVNELYSIRLNASKNFRIPTYNDLYWEGLGNENLKPETSRQFEIGNVFTFKNVEIDVAGFYLNSDDLIKWQPQNDGVWRPVNIANSENYGIELSTLYSKQIKAHTIMVSTNYSYTKAVDKETKKQVVYVPEHLFNTNVSYSYKAWSCYYQLLYNGKVYTTTDHSQELDAFDVSNIGLNYEVLNNNSQKLIVGVKVNNIYNEIYQSVASRPMPNRNFNLNINYKF